MKRKSDYQKAGEKLTKTKTRSGISAKDNTSSSYNVATRSYPGAGVRIKSTTTSKVAETAAQKKARLAKAAKIKADKVKADKVKAPKVKVNKPQGRIAKQLAKSRAAREKAARERKERAARIKANLDKDKAMRKARREAKKENKNK